MGTYTDIRYNYNLPSGFGGGLNLLATNTITSGVSSSSFTSGIDSTYRTYIFKWINIHPATNNVEWQLNFRDGSSAFDATKTTTSFLANHTEADGGASISYSDGLDLAQATGYLSLNENTYGTDADASLCGEMFLFAPSNTTFVKNFIIRNTHMATNPGSRQDYSAGYCNVTAAIDGVDFKFSSGNIDSGIIKMYGIA
jgi:hypothetical protein